MPLQSAPPPPNRAQKRRRGAGLALRALAICALTSTALALATAEHGVLSRALRVRGLAPADTVGHWLDPPGLGYRRVLLLAGRPGEPADLYVVTARTGSRDAVVAVADVSNLTRSPDAHEEAVVVSGRWAAFATRVGDRVTAFTLLDTAGAPADPGGDWGARVRASATRLQQTGRADGYGFYRYDLARPARDVALRFEGGTLAATAEGRAVRVETATRRVVAGGPFVHPRPRLAGTTGWVTWMVDTVRAVPWIGPTPIAWAEHFAFSAQHEIARARVNIAGDDSQREVAEDLADVLHANPTGDLEGPVAQWPPAPIEPMLRPALAREGTWSAAAPDDAFVARNPGAPPAFYQSFVRTDRERPDTRVYVTVWDPRQVEIHVVPGSTEPMGATGETGTGSVPRDARTLERLAGGFNGGFQALHGEWGVLAEGTMFLPPKPWGATVMHLEGGDTAFGSWPRATGSVPPEVLEFRQNLTTLVEDGVFNPYRRTFWGGTPPGSQPGESHTARTGICSTREGHVAYFWGGALTERSLADAMLAARCDYGMHLDMNGANTGFEFFRVTPTNATPALGRRLATGHEAEGPVPSAPSFTYRARRMVRGMHELGFPRYIKRDPRDYFYLLLRAVLPGRALSPPVRPALPGEGVFHVAGLGATAFPWPMARTRVRPDPSRPERWVNLVRVDPRRVELRPPEAGGSVVARFVGASAAEENAPRLAWSVSGRVPRWSIGAEGRGIAGAVLAPGAAATRAVGIDGDGFLVFAVADRAQPDLVARALDVAGCGPERLALPTTAALALSGDRDAAGAALAPGATAVFALVERAMPGATRMFPEVRPVPMRVWFDAQHRRVRYRRTDAGVEVNVVGGRSVQVPSWGPNPTTPRPAAGPQNP